MALEIDIRHEEPEFLKEFARGLPQKPSYNTIYEWCTKGRTNRSGVVVYLEYIALPGGFATSQEAYYRFLEALNW
tara:strand:+ start:53 stop:277 length:225 start_codon:yes stop_codon:yes gene_type:complete